MINSSCHNNDDTFGRDDFTQNNMTIPDSIPLDNGLFDVNVPE